MMSRRRSGIPIFFLDIPIIDNACKIPSPKGGLFVIALMLPPN
jgi:hypothetical protein